MLKLWFVVHSVRVAFVAIEVAFAFENMLVCVAVGCVAVASAAAATSLTSSCTHCLKQAGAKRFAREPCKHECARNPLIRSTTDRVRT